jgi:hypothetical protein
MICPVEIARDMSAFRTVRIRDHAKHGFLHTRTLPLLSGSCALAPRPSYSTPKRNVTIEAPRRRIPSPLPESFLPAGKPSPTRSARSPVGNGDGRKSGLALAEKTRATQRPDVPNSNWLSFSRTGQLDAELLDRVGGGTTLSDMSNLIIIIIVSWATEAASTLTLL